MNQLFGLAVETTTLGRQLVSATTPAEARAVIGVGEGGGSGGAVDSVNGKTGVVVLSASDVDALPADTPVSALPNDAGYITSADIPGSPVVSVNGKTGIVSLNAADVGAVPASAPGLTVATLVGGKVPNAQIPALAITSVFTVSSQAAQLALVAEEGDVCIRTDLSESYIRTNTNLGTMADWQKLLSPTSPVSSVNGQTGTVSITAASLGAATVASVNAGLAGKANVPEAWVTPSLGHGFTALVGYGPLQYRLNGDVVEFRGTIASSSHEGGATTLTLFTLPAGYRPSFTGIFTAQTYTTGISLARIDILADGKVDYIRSTSGTSTPYLAMDGISYAKA